MGGITIGQDAAAARATSEDTVTALHDAIGIISSVCDYAQSDDAQGFNAADAWLGPEIDGSTRFPGGPGGGGKQFRRGADRCHHRWRPVT